MILNQIGYRIGFTCARWGKVIGNKGLNIGMTIQRWMMEVQRETMGDSNG